ncbi:MAG: ATP-binding protein [Selenomonadaceae bacterium]|nr:ATP-binding protein [Selenomonadaceae bacterium]
MGRQRELSLIRERIDSDKSEAVLVYGRRRVGKSHLIMEALKDMKFPVIQYVCRKSSFQRNMEGLSREAAKTFQEPFVRFETIDQLLEYAYGKASQQKVVLFIDEYPFLRGDDEAIDSEFQIAIDKWQHRACLKIILCGSYVETMQKLVDSRAPLFGRFTEMLKLKPFDYYDVAKFFPGRSNEDKLLLYSVFGGVPFYLMQLDDRLSPAGNIKKLLIPEGSVLESEIRLQLTAELSKEENANFVLEKIASGVCKYSDISRDFSGSSGRLSHTLGKLEGMGLIEKDFPMNASSNKRQHRYVICDNLLDFYYTFLFRETTARSAMSPDDFFQAHVEEPLENDYLPRKFEQAAREYLLRQNRAGKINPPFSAIGRYVYHDKAKKQNGEFDVVTKDAKGLFSYECKYKKAPLGMKVVHKEEWKAKELGLDFYGFGFFSRSGFAEDVDASSYRLITLQDMYV